MNAVTNAVNSAVTSREVIHNFAAVAARVAAGEELTVTRYGKPLLKLVQVAKHHCRVWDAPIIAVCAEHGVKAMYSEELGSLKRPLGVQVVNPFAELEKA